MVYGHDSDYGSVYDYVQVHVRVHVHELAGSPTIFGGVFGPLGRHGDAQVTLLKDTAGYPLTVSLEV
jgi:hypothetical protein